MKCKNCNSELDESANFCKNCGTKIDSEKDHEVKDYHPIVWGLGTICFFCFALLKVGMYCSLILSLILVFCTLIFFEPLLKKHHALNPGFSVNQYSFLNIIGFRPKFVVLILLLLQLSLLVGKWWPLSLLIYLSIIMTTIYKYENYLHTHDFIANNISLKSILNSPAKKKNFYNDCFYTWV